LNLSTQKFLWIYG